MIALLLAFLLALIGLLGDGQGSVWSVSVGAEATPIASPEPGSGYAHPEWLADTAWLSEHLSAPW